MIPPASSEAFTVFQRQMTAYTMTVNPPLFVVVLYIRESLPIVRPIESCVNLSPPAPRSPFRYEAFSDCVVPRSRRYVLADESTSTIPAITERRKSLSYPVVRPHLM